MNSRQIMIAMAIILAVAIIGFIYMHSRKAAPLQDASPDATSAAYVMDSTQAA